MKDKLNSTNINQQISQDQVTDVIKRLERPESNQHEMLRNAY